MRYIPAVNVKSYDGNSSYDLYSLLLKEKEQKISRNVIKIRNINIYFKI